MNVSILPVPILSLKKFNRMTDMNIRLDYSDIKFQENGKLKLLIIVGTRPEIIRLAAVMPCVFRLYPRPYGAELRL